MAIVSEIIENEDGSKFRKTYSDAHYKIRKVGTDEVYGEAVDPIDSDREYEETDEIDDGYNEINLEEASNEELIDVVNEKDLEIERLKAELAALKGEE